MSCVRTILVVTVCAWCAVPGWASVIEFSSGKTDPAQAVRFHWYHPTRTPQGLGPQDPAGHFAAARNGPMADIRWDRPNSWGPLPSYSWAWPVFTDTYLTDWTLPFDYSWGSSSLFALPFSVPDTEIHEATLYLEYTVDNYLGGERDGSVFPGIFINEQPLSGNTHTPDPTAQRFLINQVLVRDDIGPLLLPGQVNWMYFNVSDKFPQAGILVGGRISISAVPEPGSLAVWALAGFGIVLGYLGSVFRRSRHRACCTVGNRSRRAGQ